MVSKKALGFLFANHKIGQGAPGAPMHAPKMAPAFKPPALTPSPAMGNPNLTKMGPAPEAAGTYAAPKWATNPWGEMIHRKGVKNLRNTGF